MNKQEQAVVEMLETIVSHVESKGFAPRGHRLLTTKYADMLAEKLKMGERDREQVHVAALLHEIGYLAVPRQLLDKETLNSYERETVDKHVLIGADILSKVPFLEDAAVYVRHHHENHDGSGFPDGLSGDDIPLGAQVVGMSTRFVRALNRVIDDPEGFEKAGEEVLLLAGQAFDPEIVTIFVQEAEAVFKAAIAQFRNRAANLLARLVRNVRLDGFNLPVAGQVLDRLVKSLGRNVQFEQLVKFIEADPGLTLKTISVANSSVYAGVDAVQDVRMAVLRLGVETTGELMTEPEGHNLIPVRGDDRLSLVLLHWWRESLFGAMAGRVLSQASGIGNPVICYYIGLLRPIGRSVLLQAYQERGPIDDLSEVEFGILLELIDQVAWPATRDLWEQAGIDIRGIALADAGLKPKEGEPPPPDVVKVLHTARELAAGNKGCIPAREVDVCYQDFRTILALSPLRLTEKQVDQILAKILAVYKAVYRQ